MKHHRMVSAKRSMLLAQDANSYALSEKMAYAYLYLDRIIRIITGFMGGGAI